MLIRCESWCQALNLDEIILLDTLGWVSSNHLQLDHVCAMRDGQPDWGLTHPPPPRSCVSHCAAGEAALGRNHRLMVTTLDVAEIPQHFYTRYGCGCVG